MLNNFKKVFYIKFRTCHFQRGSAAIIWNELVCFYYRKTILLNIIGDGSDSISGIPMVSAEKNCKLWEIIQLKNIIYEHSGFLQNYDNELDQIHNEICFCVKPNLFMNDILANRSCFFVILMLF